MTPEMMGGVRRPAGLWLLTAALLASPAIHLLALLFDRHWLNFGSHHPWDGFVYFVIAPVRGALVDAGPAGVAVGSAMVPSTSDLFVESATLWRIEPVAGSIIISLPARPDVTSSPPSGLSARACGRILGRSTCLPAGVRIWPVGVK